MAARSPEKDGGAEESAEFRAGQTYGSRYNGRMTSLSVAFALLTAVACATDVAPPDVQARFLAGIPVEGTELETLMAEGAVQTHVSEFTRAWQELDRRQLAPIAEWMPRAAPDAYRDTAPLFYFFSGPDFLYANAFFPNARTIVMCGTEPVGRLPDVAALSPIARANALQNLRHSLDAVLSFSFFRTQAMKEDLKNTELEGTLPVLYLFIAHAGCHIREVEKVWLDPTGNLQMEPDKIPGVRIAYTTPKGRPQTIYYFTSDLSDYGIKSSPGFMAFCAKQGIGNGLVKAASYLMHMKEFSQVRNFLLNRTRVIVQDDSGIPFQDLRAAGMNVTLAGNYEAPISLFKERYQADLHEAFKANQTMDLPFSVGYRWRLNESSLMIARAAQRPPVVQEEVVLKAVPVIGEPPEIYAEPVPES